MHKGNWIVSTFTKFRGYGLAILLCCIAVPIALRYNNPSSSFMLAAMATCLFGGRKPGLFAVALLSFLFDLLFLSPNFHLSLTSSSPVRLCFFVGAMILATEMINAKRSSDLSRLQRDTDLRSVSETCPDCVLIVDKNQEIQFANSATTKMFGYSVDEVMGKPSSFLLQDLKKDQAPEGEFLARRKPGDVLDVEATCGHFGEKTTIFLRDISDRKRVQRELEKREENLQLILDTVPALVVRRKPDGTIDYVNRHATEYFGYTGEEFCNGAWIEVFHPDEKERVLEEIQRNIRAEQMYMMEYRTRRFDGTYRWFQTTCQPLRGLNGLVTGWYGVLADIDDRRRIEDSLRQTGAKLSKAAQIATAAELSASIVHEISQPIAAMVANGQACLRWLSADPPNIANGKSAIERIVRDGKDAKEIIKGLRTIFKRSSPQKKFLNLREIVDEVIVLTRGRVVREGVSVSIEMPIDLPMVMGDPIQLQQVVLNLVSNAIEAMHSNRDRPKILFIRAYQADQMVLTEVIDNGEGISNIEDIFEVFFTTKENGMGVGLPISKSIIEAHEGRLWAANGASVGSVMSFALPYANLMVSNH